MGSGAVTTSLSSTAEVESTTTGVEEKSAEDLTDDEPRDTELVERGLCNNTR